MVTLADVADLITFGSSSRSAALRSARARRLHAEASAHASAEITLMRASLGERFAVACAAPYRERVAFELQAAARDGRRAPRLQVVELPGSAARWKASLAHDFGVTDAATADTVTRERTRLALALVGRDTASATLLAAQGLHVATAAAGTGLWDRADALDACDGLSRLVRHLHGGWAVYAQAFLAGERTSGNPDDVRHIVFEQAVGRLLVDERSPWAEVPWSDAAAA